MPVKPTMFIGSSVESIEVARAVQAELKYDVDATLWNQGIFALSRSTLGELLAATHEHDYAAFILAPEDIATIREQTQSVPRDNVMFELGMFFGALGSERCFFLVPENVKDFHIPTDLAGITPAKYNPSHKGGLQAGVGTACSEIRTAIKGSAKAVSLSGVWKQTWVTMTKEGDRRTNESIAELAQAGNRVRATFQSLGHTYEMQGTIERGNLVTGRWYDTAAGPTYFGAFQLVIDALASEMKGQWVGWSQSGMVRADEWIWTRISAKAADKG